MRGFIVLAVVILGIVLTLQYKEVFFPPHSNKQILSRSELQELEKFSQQIEKTHPRNHNQQAVFQKGAEKSLKPFAFDPNTADSSTLSQIGLKSWQISNLLKYRAKGGKWKKADDFAKLYGLTSEDFQTLRPFIKIQPSPRDLAKAKEKSRRDSIHRSYPKKFETGTVLSLNQADTTLLKGIPGIGSYYANKICRYRNRLGGFVSLNQLKEIDGLPTDVEKWFTLTPNDTIRKTKINQADFKELVRHPYLNYEQVKAIRNYIQKYGKIKSWEDLSNSEHFSEADFKRLLPYASFE